MLEGCKLKFVNVECAVTEHNEGIKKFGPCLKTGKDSLWCLKEIGFNVCGLSNNHIFDYGRRGAEDTIKALNELGPAYTGFGDCYLDSRKNFIFENNGEKIAIIAVCEHEYSYALDDRMGARPYDEYDTMSDIRSVRNECDRVIVIYHGGKEHCRYPSPRLRKLCHAMVDNGADLVVCQHSHCIGCYEEYLSGHIVYGQGNYHFIYDAMKDKKSWNESLAIHYDTVNNTIEFTPIISGEKGITLAKGEEKARLLREFHKRNDELKDGTWICGWREFCAGVQDYYIAAAKKAEGESHEEIGDSIFAHYLDCEAHTDVWRELFKTANYRNEKD